jgi:hypothetical protein
MQKVSDGTCDSPILDQFDIRSAACRKYLETTQIAQEFSRKRQKGLPTLGSNQRPSSSETPFQPQCGKETSNSSTQLPLC